MDQNQNMNQNMQGGPVNGQNMNQNFNNQNMQGGPVNGQNMNQGFNQNMQGGPNYQNPNPGFNSNMNQNMPAPKDKVTAGLLALFLGGFGIHKFYLGYTTEGIIILLVQLLLGPLTLGFIYFITGPILLIEAIIYLTKSDEDFYRTYVLGHRGWF